MNVNKMAVSATDEDYVIECSAMGDAELIIEVEPSMNTYEEYFYGFTADSASQLSISADPPHLSHSRLHSLHPHSPHPYRAVGCPSVLCWGSAWHPPSRFWSAIAAAPSNQCLSGSRLLSARRVYDE